MADISFEEILSIIIKKGVKELISNEIEIRDKIKEIVKEALKVDVETIELIKDIIEETVNEMFATAMQSGEEIPPEDEITGYFEMDDDLKNTLGIVKEDT